MRGVTILGPGWVYLLVGVMVGLGYVLTSSPVLAVIGCAQLIVGVLTPVICWVNLLGVRVQRGLPDELFAGVVGYGDIWVSKTAPFASIDIEIWGEGQIPAVVEWLPGTGLVKVQAGWRCHQRGLVRLGSVQIGSGFPFGFIFIQRELYTSDEMIVYPRPVGVGNLIAEACEGDTISETRSLWGIGYFSGLVEHCPGDDPRRIHWPTTARLGHRMTVICDGSADQEVVVRVEEAMGSRWESNLSAATAAVQRHFRAGHSVGLWLEDQQLAPHSGARWRQRLLSLLALASERNRT